MNQTEKANHFRSLHSRGAPVVLYNIWDAGGARALEKAGALAVATGSWSVAAAHGYEDGEQLPLDFALRVVGRIAASVDLPLSVDFEGGYAEEPVALGENVAKLIAAGAIGLNFEDRVIGGSGLYPVAQQSDRITAIRAAADDADVPLFINARTDLFLGTDPATHGAAVPDAIERAAAYQVAGADGFFIPGLTDKALIKEICDSVDLPVNAMMMRGLETVAELGGLGVARVSFGPLPYSSAMKDLAERFRSVV